MQWFKVPNKIFFEKGSIKYLEVMRDISRVFIVTDKAMVKLGYTDKILYYLRNRKNKVHSYIFDQVEPDPSFDTINKGVDMMRKFVKVDLPDVSKFITPISQPTTIDSHIDINLPNVENGVDFIAELKKPKVQKALQSVTTDLLAGGSKLGINRFK